MFWNVMSEVHNLPTLQERENGEWWTNKEKEILEVINYQLSYCRPWKENEKEIVHKYPVYDSGKGGHRDCLGPVQVSERGNWVLGLSKGYQDFFEKELGIGKYIGSITREGVESKGLCTHCFERDNISEEEFERQWQEVQSHRGKELVYDCDMEGYGKIFNIETDMEIVDDWIVTCPMCGNEARVRCYEEVDVETIWIFEKGSIMYAHYGRGAGLSFRFHNSLEYYNGQKGEELLEMYEEIDLDS